MFDYKLGLSSSKLNWSIPDLLPRLELQQTSKGQTLVLQYLSGIEVAQSARISKSWYAASISYELWKELCQGPYHQSKCSIP